ncbi:IS5 family transposase [Nonomuraea sp. NPDC049709]|uniref:IS5 family transposase n=1 Tax=Nonomuraea sp. NPDC049709 TaxID=3154736 RepID=UPI00342AC773
MRPRRYPSDTTDEEWLLLEPLLPVPACRTRKGGRPEKHHRRDIVDAIRYITDNGAKWRALPADFPPYQTVFGFFSRWARTGVLNQIRDQLRRAVRLRASRCPNPVTGVIDSQSVRAAATVTGRSRSYDAGKRVGGRKRHLVVDTLGLLMGIMVTPAGQPDGDTARELLARLRMLHPQLTLVWADSAYAGGMGPPLPAPHFEDCDQTARSDRVQSPRETVDRRKIHFVADERSTQCDRLRTQALTQRSTPDRCLDHAHDQAADQEKAAGMDPKADLCATGRLMEAGA